MNQSAYLENGIAIVLMFSSIGTSLKNRIAVCLSHNHKYFNHFIKFSALCNSVASQLTSSIACDNCVS
nr:hypothetical protein [bacterium]